MDYNQIVWLASYPKSGNTWVRMFLDAYFLGEVDINEVLTSVPDNHASRHGVGDGSNITGFSVDIQQLTRPMALLRMVRQYHKHKVEGIPLYVKSHNQHVVANGIDLLPLSLTKAVIHIVRDPRDVLPSFATHTGKSLDEALERMEDKFNVMQGNGVTATVSDFTGSWGDYVKSYLNADTHNVRTWKYEDMKADPVRCFSEMLEHSGVTPDMDKVKAAVKEVALSRLKKQEKEAGFKESSPYAKNRFFGTKHEKITPKQANSLKKAFGRTMKRLGYD